MVNKHIDFNVNQHLPDCFVIGSGFSKAIYSGMPLLDEVTIELLTHPAAGPIIEKYRDIGNVEQIMSYLNESLPWTAVEVSYQKQSEFVTVSKALAELMWKKQIEFSNSDYKHNFAKPFIEGLQLSASEVLSFNYDMIVEALAVGDRSATTLSLMPIPLANLKSRFGSAACVSIAPNNQMKLYKLHGSINWYYSGRDNYYGEQIFESPALKPPPDSSIFDKTPLLIPPTFSKNRFFNNETIKGLWRMALEALVSAKRVFIIGYSFPESDQMIRYFFSDSLKRSRESKEIIVVDPCEATFNRIETLIEKGNSIIRFKSSTKEKCFQEFVDAFLNHQFPPISKGTI